MAYDLNQYDQLFLDAAQKWGVDPQLLKSIAKVEDGLDAKGRPNTSSAGAVGIMQFMPGTAKDYGVNPTDVGSSIDGAAHYVSDLLNQYGSPDIALDHYSGHSKGYGNAVLDAYRTVAQPVAPGGQAPQETKVPPAGPGLVHVDEGQYGSANLRPGYQNAPAYPAVSDTPGSREQRGVPTTPVTSQQSTPPAQEPPVAEKQQEPDLSGLSPEERAVFEGKPPPPTPTQPTQGDTSGLSPAEQKALADNPPQQPPPVAPTPSTWFGRYVSAPFAAMEEPSAPQPPNNYMLGQPWLQSTGAGVSQGVRDVGTTLNNVDAYLAGKIPYYSEADRLLGYTPGQNQASDTAATKAFENQYGGDWWASGGRLGGNMLATAPIAPAARVLEAVPRAGPYLAAAFGGGAQNALTGGGQTPEDWWRDFDVGAAGGGALRMGGALGRRLLYGPAETPVNAIADRLGVDLSAGQQRGGIVKRIEDTTAPFPGSGGLPFAQQQRQQIAGAIGREMGIPGNVTQLTTPILNAAETRIGSNIENAAQRIDIPGAPLRNPFQTIANNANQAGLGTDQANTFRNLSTQLENIAQNNNGIIPGQQFQQFIARGGPLDNALNSSNGDVRRVAQQIRETLLNTAQAGGQGAQDALNDLRNARYQWKVLQTVRPSIDRNLQGSEEMSLPKLATAIENEFDMTRPSGPQANMQDVARLVRGPLSTLPSSGTAERLLWQKILTGEGLANAGAAAGSFLSGLPHLATIAAGLSAVPAVAGRYLRYGGGLGIPALQATQETLNPLVPRVAGGVVGREYVNPLMAQTFGAPSNAQLQPGERGR